MAAQFPRTVTVPTFIPNPLGPYAVPQNPFMAPNGCNNMHCDAYMSDTYGVSGPNGGELVLNFGQLPGLCATLTFTQSGQIVTVCSTQNSQGEVVRLLLLIDPDSLAVLASYDLPSGGGGTTGFGGGGYMYLNNMDQPVVPTADQQIMIFEITNQPSFTLLRTYDLAPFINDPGASIQSALPDWTGNIWWVTDTGLVGFLIPASGAVLSTALPTPHGSTTPEQIGNSFALDETGGVFIVSNYAMYRFDVGTTGPVITWRYSYDRGSMLKPGQQNFGSGTTPTLIGGGANAYLGITDNADPQMHVVVYRRGIGVSGNRKVGEQAVFAPNYSDSENSLIGFGNSFIVENNYGYNATATSPTGPVAPGLARVLFEDGGSVPPSGCTLDWENNRVVIPSVVTKASLTNGLIYTYSLDQATEAAQKVGGMWYITAVNAHTGDVAFSVYVGDGVPFDNHYAALYVSPTGVVYVPVWTGLVSLAAVA